MEGALSFHQVWRYLHITAGFFGLAVFWVPVLAKKGGTVHIWAGRLFALCASVVGVTAVVSSAWALVDPMGFIGRPQVSMEAMVQIERDIRFFFSILLLLALTLLQSVYMGRRLITTRSTPTALASRPLKALTVLTGVVAVGLTAFGAVHVPNAGPGSRYLISIVLGLLSAADARSDWRFLTNPRPSPRAWWYKHMGCMLGAGIAFHTAFVVFGARRWLDLQLLGGPLALLPWVLPTAIGVPAISIWIRYYRRRFGDLTPPAASAS